MQLRRISSSLTTTDGTHTRPRNVSTDQYGFVCAAYTPDGESTGLVYEMAMTAKVSPPVINRHILTEILMFQLRDIIKEIAAPVSANAEVFFVFDSNSVPICKTSNKDEFIERFRKLRRTLTISPYSFVCFQQNVIVVQSDEGFLCRPLLIISEISRLRPRTLSTMLLHKALSSTSVSSSRRHSVRSLRAVRRYVRCLHTWKSHRHLFSVSCAEVRLLLLRCRAQDYHTSETKENRPSRRA